MPLPVIAAALARAGPALAQMFASGGGTATLTQAGTKAAGTLGSKAGGMDMSLLSNPAAYEQGGPSNSTPAPPTPTASGLSNFMGGMRGGLNDMGFTGLAKGIYEVTEKLRAWTDGLHSSNMQFAEFSASMAAVQAQAEVREYHLKKEQGEKRAGSAAFLANQKGNLDQTLAPIENIWAKFENVVGGGLLIVLNELLRPLSIVAKFLDNATDSEGPDPIGADEAFARLGLIEMEAKGRRPERLR